MATTCPYTIQIIQQDEYIGNSLDKINSNFTALASAACNLEQYLDSAPNIRTFFYYGPNSATDPTSNMVDNASTRPSNTTIQTFVNTDTGLNLLPVSKKYDQTYIIYQKTGWTSTNTSRPASGSGSIPYRVISSQRYAYYSWSQTINDVNYSCSPNFVVYRLTHDGIDYKVDLGFPRFVRAQSGNTFNWNNPKLWITY